MSMDYTKVQARISTDHGDIVLKFFPDVAPKHVESFCALAQKGFYNGGVFHRVISGFMIQGGCPKGNGSGGPGYTLKAEFNAKSHKRGVLSMARMGHDVNSGGSQFFIMHKDNPGLDRQYTVFGEVVTGLDVVDKIASAPTSGDRPKSPVKMNSVTVESV